MEKQEKANFHIYSLSGMAFSGAQQTADNQLTEFEISLSLFHGDVVEHIELTPQTFNMSVEDAEHEGFCEDVLVYYSLSQTEIWNYNPMISVHVGKPVYSPILLFVTPSMFKDSNSKHRMSNEVFMKIVNYFIESTKQYLANIEKKDETTEIKAEEPKRPRSPKFNLSSITYVVGGGCDIVVTEDLDEHWEEHFVRAYHPDFCFNGMRCVNKDGKETKKTVLIKPNTYTLIDEISGDVEVYTAPQYTKESMEKVYEKIAVVYHKYADAISDREKEKAKQKEIKNIVNEYFSKIGS